MPKLGDLIQQLLLLVAVALGEVAVPHHHEMEGGVLHAVALLLGEGIQREGGIKEGLTLGIPMSRP